MMIRRRNDYSALQPPLVSVVIPNYNGEKWVARAIESAAAQTYKPFEIVAVDDGSQDRSVQEMEAWKAQHPQTPLRIIRQQNQGVCAARNRGVAEARGRFIAFLDSDDLWGAKKLERQMAVVLAASPHNQENAFCLCDHTIETVNERQEAVSVQYQDFHPKSLKEWVGSWPSSWLVARKLFDAAGGFDPRMVCVEDTDFQVRCMRAGAVMMNAGYDKKTEPPHLRYFAPQAGKRYKNLDAMGDSVRLFLEKNGNYLQATHPKQYARWLEKALARIQTPAYAFARTEGLCAMLTERLDATAGQPSQKPYRSLPPAAQPAPTTLSKT